MDETSLESSGFTAVWAALVYVAWHAPAQTYSARGWRLDALRVHTVVTVVLWIDQFCHWMAVFLRHMISQPGVEPRWRLNLVSLILVALYSVVYVVPWPVELEFYANEHALQRAANQYLARGCGNRNLGRVGFLPVQEVFGPSRGFVFFQVTRGEGIRRGFMYCGPTYQAETYCPHRWFWVAPGWYVATW